MFFINKIWRLRYSPGRSNANRWCKWGGASTSKKRIFILYLNSMRKHLTCLFVAIAFFAQSQTGFNYAKDFNTVLAKTKDKNDPWNYYKLLSRFKKNDSTLTNPDILALMIGFTSMPQYDPYSSPSKERVIVDLNAEGKYEQALEKADEYIALQPLSIKILFERSFAYYKAHMEDSAKKFSGQAKKIFNAMKYSGDGKTIQRPIFSLNVDDAQEYILKFLSAGTGLKGSQKDENNNSVDFIEVVTKVQEPYNLYFMVQHIHDKLPLDLEDPVKKEKKLKKESEK